MTVTAALTAIAATVAGVSGVKTAPANPQENINEYPFALVYAMEGVQNIGPIGARKVLFNVAIDLLTIRRDISIDMAILTPFLDSIPGALSGEIHTSGDLFSGTIQTFENVRFEFLPAYPYAGADMIGYRFVMENIKILVDL